MFNLGIYWYVHYNIEDTNANAGLKNFKKGIVELPLHGWKYWDGAEWNGNDDTLQFIEGILILYFRSEAEGAGMDGS